MLNTLDPPSTHYSLKSNNTINNIPPQEDYTGGESVKVVLRVRPMNTLEKNRGDEYCIKLQGDNSV